jgi:hypothetical protein
VQGLGAIQGSGYRVWVQYRVQGAGFGCNVGFRVQGLGAM